MRRQKLSPIMSFRKTGSGNARARKRILRIKGRVGEKVVEQLEDRHGLDETPPVDLEARDVAERVSGEVRFLPLLPFEQVHGNVLVRRAFRGQRETHAVRRGRTPKRVENERGELKA